MRRARSLADLVLAGLCLWAAWYHTPPGALLRTALARLFGSRSAAPALLSYYGAGARSFQLAEPLPPRAALSPGAALGLGAQSALEKLGIGPDIPVITRQEVQRAKPDPDLFLAAAQRLNVPIARAMVVGDSVWDLLAARRAGCLGIGLLSGGYGKEELEQVGAYRVYLDPADLLAHLDEVGIRIMD